MDDSESMVALDKNGENNQMKRQKGNSYSNS